MIASIRSRRSLYPGSSFNETRKSKLFSALYRLYTYSLNKSLLGVGVIGSSGTSPNTTTLVARAPISFKLYSKSCPSYHHGFLLSPPQKSIHTIKSIVPRNDHRSRCASLVASHVGMLVRVPVGKNPLGVPPCTMNAVFFPYSAASFSMTGRYISAWDVPMTTTEGVSLAVIPPA